MIFKAIIYVESRFQYDAVGCTGNGPCCPARGWTAAECACLGAMQTGPWCNSSNLPPGARRAGSACSERARGHGDEPQQRKLGQLGFQPVVNIELGIAGIACNRAQAKAAFRTAPRISTR